jgi:glycosyltransferase involved in cell wall biosynthesis
MTPAPPPPTPAPPEPRPGARSLYAAFDRFPSSKGAAVHIREFADTLFAHCGGGVLHVLGGDALPPYQLEATDAGDPVEIVRFTQSIPNLLDRIDAYGAQLAAVAHAHRASLELLHVRDPWSAAPLLAARPQEAPRVARRAPLVFEVNGLPSIELPYAYPGLGASTLAKVRELELACLRRADAVVTPSAVLAGRLRALAPDAAPISIVRNGAKVPTATPPRPSLAPARYVVYVGALQPWQGIDTLLAAFRRLADLDDVRLVVCSATPPKRARPWQRLAARLGVEGRVDWHFKVPHRDVAAWLAHAELSVAPLADCARNVDQGCCPLKVLESMAAGTAVIASDLAVTRELVADGEHGRLVPPDRPAELARAIRVALEHPERTAAMGAAAQAHVRRSLTWDHSRAALLDVYRGVQVPGASRAAE